MNATSAAVLEGWITAAMEVGVDDRARGGTAAAAEVLRKHGAKSAFKGYPGPYPFPAVTTVCLDEELVHGIPGTRRLKEGEIVSIDCGAIVDGFVGDSAMTVAVGDVDDEAQRIIDATLQSLLEGIDRMRVGNRSGDVSAAIQACVETRGFQVVREYTGHGIGRQMHEDPQIPNFGIPGTGDRLSAGMVFALEPMVNAGDWHVKTMGDGWTVVTADEKRSAHFEHSIAITDGEAEILSAF